MDIHYGSFARHTKIRELDDIDIIICIKALGTTYYESDRVQLKVPDNIRLRNLCHDNTCWLNSRKVINCFVKHLSTIPQYDKADIGRNGVAAVLNLKSYSWSFDLVPGFFTTPEIDGRTYYIIPDGNGHWMKTDPRLDRDRVIEINQKCNGNILNLIRIIKFWNKRSTMPTMSSYLLECIILNYCILKATTVSEFVDLEIANVLDYISSSIYSDVQDPKNIQGNINNLSWTDRINIANRAKSDAVKVVEARQAENDKDYRKSIRLWSEIFGPSFPTYG